MAMLHKRYRIRLLAISLALIFSAVLEAETLVPLNLSYQRIALANGRILKDVTLNSFNRESGLIYVYEKHRLKPYPAMLFPAFVNETIARRTAEVPAPRESENNAPPPAPIAKGDADSPAPIGSPEAHASERIAITAAVIAKAEKAALNHLRYRQQIGSGYVTVTDAAIDLDPPEAIAGWPNRYRVKGNGFYAYYESVGGAFHRRARGVEVILEAPSPQQIKVISVDTLWTQN
jgi:hypothetical protein